MSMEPNNIEPCTVDELVEHVLSDLNPRAAQRMRGHDYAHKCTTPIIESMKTENGIVELRRFQHKLTSHLAEKYAAIYARVSTESQNNKNKRLSEADLCAGSQPIWDGFSMRDQLTRGINFCITKRMAFRIYSDAEISGGDPPDNPEVIKELFTMKAEKYMAAIDAVFLSEYNTLRTPQEKDKVRDYMRDNITGILQRSGEEDDAWKHMFDIELNGSSLVFKPKTQISFRPALTLLMADLEENVHTLIVNEISRLSRSTALTAKIMRTLYRNKVHYVGMVESTQLFKDHSFTGQVITDHKAKDAEEKLYEVCMNSVRGMVAMLDSGRPHSTLNFWLERDQWGYGRLKRTRHQLDKEITGEELGHKIINLWLKSVEEGHGLNFVCDQLMCEGIRAPRGGNIWNVGAIAEMLANKTLIGIHSCFGLEWPILEPLIDIELWNKIQQIRGERENLNPGRTRVCDGHLLTSLLRCKCGGLLQNVTNNVRHSRKTRNYRCYRRGRAIHGQVDHITLLEEDIEGFFNTLMREYSTVIFNKLRHDQRPTDFEERRRVKQAEVSAKKRELDALLPVRAQEARRSLFEDGYAESDPEWSKELKAAIQRKMYREQRKLDILKSELEGIQYLQVTDIHTRLLGLEARVNQWDNLHIRERNDILKQLFKPIEIHGPAGQEYLRIRSTNVAPLDNLPDIYLKCRPWVGTRWERRMPTVAEWIAAWDI